jgi:hypothetical protein
MMTRAAALIVALTLLSSSAFAASSSQRFTVGAVVMRSATVVTSPAGVQQVASRGTSAPMLLAADGLKPMPQSGAAQLSAGSSGEMTVTLLY